MRPYAPRRKPPAQAPAPAWRMPIVYDFGVDWENLIRDEAIDRLSRMPDDARAFLRLFAAAPDSVRLELIDHADARAADRAERRARRTG